MNIYAVFMHFLCSLTAKSGGVNGFLFGENLKNRTFFRKNRIGKNLFYKDAQKLSVYPKEII